MAYRTSALGLLIEELQLGTAELLRTIKKNVQSIPKLSSWLRKVVAKGKLNCSAVRVMKLHAFLTKLKLD